MCMESILKKGALVVISAPSGGGKTAVINRLIELVPNSARLVTLTSRPPRVGEVDGVDYIFLTKEEFEDKIKQNDLIEHVEYVGHYYGIGKRELAKLLDRHIYVFAAIDINGKKSLDRIGIPHVSIFLLPESLNNLRVRLARRPNLTIAETERRLRIAEKEIGEAVIIYDHKIINRERKFERTLEEVMAFLPNAARPLDRNRSF